MLPIKKVMGVLLTTAAISFLLTGCYKDRTIVSETGDEITRTVSFANDIIPLFNSSCNSSGCHNSGGKAPDLSSANAFTSLSNGNYINISDPLNSELYLWMTGKKGSPMPLSGINKEYNALILAWIKQGGGNN
jgi:hypothetical protein